MFSKIFGCQYVVCERRAGHARNLRALAYLFITTTLFFFCQQLQRSMYLSQQRSQSTPIDDTDRWCHLSPSPSPKNPAKQYRYRLPDEKYFFGFFFIHSSEHAAIARHLGWLLVVCLHSHDYCTTIAPPLHYHCTTIAQPNSRQPNWTT